MCGRLVNWFTTEDIVDLSAIALCQARIILISVILVTHRLKSCDETRKTQGEVGKKKKKNHCKIKVIINTTTSTEYDYVWTSVKPVVEAIACVRCWMKQRRKS